MDSVAVTRADAMETIGRKPTPAEAVGAVDS